MHTWSNLVEAYLCKHNLLIRNVWRPNNTNISIDDVATYFVSLPSSLPCLGTSKYVQMVLWHITFSMFLPQMMNSSLVLIIILQIVLIGILTLLAYRCFKCSLSSFKCSLFLNFPVLSVKHFSKQLCPNNTCHLECESYFSDHIPLFPLEERNTFCWWPGNVPQIDLVGTNGQRQTAYS